jgi:putative FmdB family regulatory protein
MILYEYECPCGHIFQAMNTIEDRLNHACEKCGQLAKQILTHHQSRDWFQPHWSEHFDWERPVFVKSREHMKELCHDYKVYSRALGPLDDRRGC